MENRFSRYLKKKKPIIKKLVDELLLDYSYVSCLATDVKGESISVDRFSTSITPSAITESGFVVKVYNGSRYSEYSFNEIDEKNYQDILNDIKRVASEEFDIKEVSVKALEEKPLKKSFTRKNEGKDYETSEIVSILQGYVNEAISKNELVINARCGIENTEISKMFISKEKDLEQYYTWSGPRCFVLVRRDDNTKYAYDGFGYNSIEKGLAELKERMEKAANLAVELLDATPPKPGIYDVITDSSITGLIAHEAFGHGVEMDMFVKDRAKAKEFMNKRVASKLVNMHDGAKSCLSAASYFFDDDGVLAHDTKIIKNGILKAGISDALSALQLGTEPTGNGRRENYKHKAYTRMTNTFFEGGNDNLSDMIKSIDYGYMIFDTNNGMEDPKNWGIQCTALYGREIKNGEFTGKLISPVVMSGNVIDLLNSISAVSKDVVVTGSGSCGKGYKEWVRVSDGGACLKAKVKIG